MEQLSRPPRVLDIPEIDTIHGLAVTPDSRQFLTAGFSGVHRWDLKTFECICTYSKPLGVVS